MSKLPFLVSCVLLSSTATTAWAQSSDPVASDATRSAPELATQDGPAAEMVADDIVVTAQRKSERLQDVAIAISAFSGDMLKSRGFTSGLDIAKFTPGINASGSSGGQGIQFSIRGVTQSDYNDAIEAPVAVYVDDVYISSQQGQNIALFDIARVEALKGPQGTLFGRNATGGLVHFVVNKPELDMTSGYVEGTYGRFNQTTLEGAINLPIASGAAVRVSGFWSRHDPVWKNLYPQGVVAGAPLTFAGPGPSPKGQDLGSEDTLATRAQLRLDPADTVQVRLTGSVLRQDLSSSPWTTSSTVPILDDQNRVVGGSYAGADETRSAIGPDGQNFFNPAVLAFQGFQYSPNGDGRRAPGASWLGFVPLDIDKRQLSVDFARKKLNTFRVYNSALHVDADLGDTQLASVTAWSQYRKAFFVDSDSSPVNVFGFATNSNIKTMSQELRLSGAADTFSWTGGLYYLNIDADAAQGLIAPSGSALSVVFGLPAGLDAMSVFNLKTSSASLFANSNWEFSPGLTLVIGARGIYEHQKYEFSSAAYLNENDYTIDTGAALFPLQPSFSDNRGDFLWAGKAQLEYRPDSGLLFYGGINRGVKAGSYNAKLADGTPPLAPASIPYEPETLLSYEGGFKLTGLAGRYTLNASIYHYDYKSFQSFTFSDISGFVQNRDAVTNGVELEGTVRLGRDLKIGMSGAYLDAQVKDVQIAPGVSRDVRPTYTPKWSGSATVNYDVPVEIAGGSINLGAVVSHQSNFFSNARNFDSQLFDSRTLVDFSASWRQPDGFSLTVFAKNAFDARYKIVGLDLTTACGCNVEAYGMPATWGVTAGFSF